MVALSRAATLKYAVTAAISVTARAARARLLAEPGDIASAGFAVGYGSPSQFSREYRRMFGAPPRQDVTGWFIHRDAGGDNCY